MYRQIFSFVFVFVFIQAQAQNFLISTDSTNFPNVQLNEVKVISSKEIRNNKIVELPTAVSVIDYITIKQNEINTLNGISGLIPNLFMPDYGTKLTSPIYLRGVGSRINSPSVGLYVDNVPYFEKAAFDFDFYDIERIEVLRGPQGTLYGRNTMGGIVNIYTRDPGTKRETNLDLSAGMYDYYKGMLSHIQPLGEKTSLLVNTSVYNYGGNFENLFTGTNVDKINSVSGRIKLISNLSRNIKTTYSMNLEKSRQEGYPYAIYNEETGEAGMVDYDYESSYDRFILSNNFQLKYMRKKFTIISNSSYQYLDGYQDIDQDFTTANLFGVVQDQKQHMFSQEITLNSTAHSNYSYILGVFAFTQLFDSKVDVEYKSDFTSVYGLPDPYTKYKSYDNTVSGIAAFHQSTLSDFLIEGLDVIAGVRFDMEKASQNYLYELQMGTTLSTPGDFDYSLDYFKVMPKIAFSYQCAKNINTYATIAQGYKTGGFNTTIERDEDESFEPEESINYELGIKSDFFNKKLRANFSVFYIDWYNQQIYQTVPSGQGSMIKNAGRSYSKGVEVELNLRVLDGLNIYSNLGLTEAKFTSYEKDSVISYSGNYLPYVPGLTLQSGINYGIAINGNFIERINLQLSYTGFGKHYWNEGNTAFQDYYGLLNSNLSIETQYFTLSIWGKNLSNTDYHSFYFSSMGNSFVQLGKPLMLGTTLRIKI